MSEKKKPGPAPKLQNPKQFPVNLGDVEREALDLAHDRLHMSKAESIRFLLKVFKENPDAIIRLAYLGN